MGTSNKSIKSAELAAELAITNKINKVRVRGRVRVLVIKVTKFR